jgi:hypothetical protein
MALKSECSNSESKGMDINNSESELPETDRMREEYNGGRE